MVKILKDCLKPLYLFLKSKSYREFIRLHSRYTGQERFIKQLAKFLNYQVTIIDGPSFVYQFKDIFYDEIFKFETSKIDPVIIDCGANIGLSCLYFKKLYPASSITAFEADPNIFKKLKENIIANGEAAKIEFINKAVWVHTDGVTFNQEGADGGSILGEISNPIKVESVRLKDWLDKKKVDFLKMDIEGAEVEVLADCGSSLRNVENIFLEYHSFAGQTQQLDKLLKVITDNGFKYNIESHINLHSPFINVKKNTPLDLLLNIYCYRL